MPTLIQNHNHERVFVLTYLTLHEIYRIFTMLHVINASKMISKIVCWNMFSESKFLILELKINKLVTKFDAFSFRNILSFLLIDYFKKSSQYLGMILSLIFILQQRDNRWSEYIIAFSMYCLILSITEYNFDPSDPVIWSYQIKHQILPHLMRLDSLYYRVIWRWFFFFKSMQLTILLPMFITSNHVSNEILWSTLVIFVFNL